MELLRSEQVLAPMSLPLALSLMIVYLIIGFAIGRSTRNRRSAAIPDQPRARETKRLLDDMRLDLSHQTEELGSFNRELALHAADTRHPQLLRATLERAEVSSRHFDERFAGRAEQIASRNLSSLTELAAVLDQFAGHRALTHEMTERLGTVLAQTDLTGVAASLSSVVGTILDSHERLAAELQQAREVISRQQERLQTAEREARIDPLTRLLNRRAFEEQLAASHAEFRRGGDSYSLAMLDIDHFKRLNDEFGHPTGDAALAVLGRVLTECVRSYDVAARVGGEEFCILFRRTGTAEAERCAERIRARVERTEVRHGSHLVRFTISAGVAEAAHDGDANATLARADAALYEAKQQGRNRVEVSRAGSVPVATAS